MARQGLSCLPSVLPILGALLALSVELPGALGSSVDLGLWQASFVKMGVFGRSPFMSGSTTVRIVREGPPAALTIMPLVTQQEAGPRYTNVSVTIFWNAADASFMSQAAVSVVRPSGEVVYSANGSEGWSEVKNYRGKSLSWKYTTTFQGGAGVQSPAGNFVLVLNFPAASGFDAVTYQARFTDEMIFE